MSKTLGEIFLIKNGLASFHLEISETNIFGRNGLPYIRPSHNQNSSIAGYLDKRDVEQKYIFPRNSIYVSTDGEGSHTYSYVSANEFVPNSNVSVLIPKTEMDFKRKLFYSLCITKNRYRFSYARKPKGKRLENIFLPSAEEIPSWVYETKIPEPPSQEPYHNKKISLKDREWVWFEYKKIFDIKKGYYNKKPESSNNGIPFIGATEYNNGFTSFHTFNSIQETSKDGSKNNHPLNHKLFQNCISISNNGSVGYAFYHRYEFTCSHDVNPIYVKEKNLNPYIAIFLNTTIGLEKYRWDYGRKWRPMRMANSKIKLPIDSAGNPDWQFMEDYIKSLPYSSNL